MINCYPLRQQVYQWRAKTDQPGKVFILPYQASSLSDRFGWMTMNAWFHGAWQQQLIN